MRFVLDGDAELVGRYEYGPFGDPYGHVGAGTSFQFAGELWDEASQLYYLRARHYNPALGRFMTRDPFAGLVQMPQTLHPYAYVGNNPVNLTDPSGEIGPLVLVAIGAGTFVVGGGIAAWDYRQANPCSDLLHDRAFWEAVLRGGAIGVVGSVTAAAVFTVMPVGCLGAAIQAGVISGIFGGGAAQITANVIDEQPLYYGLDRAAVSGGLTGGVFGGAGYSVSTARTARANVRVSGAFDDLLAATKKSRSKFVGEIPGTVGDAEAYFRHLAKPGTIRLHPKVEGGYLAEGPGDLQIGFRPFSSTDYPTIDLHKLHEAGMSPWKKIKFKP